MGLWRLTWAALLSAVVLCAGCSKNSTPQPAADAAAQTSQKVASLHVKSAFRNLGKRAESDL